MANLKKTIAIIFGLLGGVGFTYLIKTMNIWTLSDEAWVGLGIVLTISFGSSLYFMMKGGGG